MDRDHTEDDKEAQLRTLLEERSHPIIALDDDSDNEVTLDENTDPLGVQDSQVIVNQYGEPIYIDNPNAMLELLNLNNESGSVYIQQFGEPLNENGVIIDDNDGEPIYIDDSEPKKDYYIQGSGPEEVICIKDDADDAEEENTPICIEDSDDDSNSLTENKEPEKESEEKSKSIEDSDNEESSSPISDGSHKSDESHESDASESSDSSSDSSSSEESTDTESESDESSNDEQEPNKSSNKLKETLPEINMTSSESDSNEPQHKKLKKKKKKDNRDKQDFIQSKLNKWFLAEFESHMGLKLGESDDSPSISKPLEESDSEKSTSSSIRRNRYSDDSSSDESLGRWYSKTKWSSSDEDNEYDQTQEMQIEEGIEDEDSRNDNNEEYGSDTGARNFEGQAYRKYISEDANSVINNTVEYGSMPIITSPMPSMPFYEAESPQFQMMETPKPLDVIQSPKSEEATENKTDPRLDSENEEDLSDIETSSYFSSSQSSDDSDSEVIPKRKKKFTYWDDMSELPVDTGEISQEQLQGIFEDEEMLTRSERDSDSAKLDNDGYDFYEDPIPLQDNSESFSFMVIKDDNIFDEYEQSVLRLFTMVSKIPSQHRFEIHLMVYPMLAITYLQMVASDNMSRAIDFLENKSCQLDESYSFRLTKLADICRLEDIPNKARKQLAGYEKLELQMSRGAYRQLLFHLEEWPRGQQEKVLTHFGVLSYSEDEEPQQRPILGKQHLETLYWAAPEPIHQRDFTIRPLLRGRRRKWNESPQRKNINIPPSDRIYSPTIERMGLVRRKNDENHRVKLDRDNLPSAYLYSAPGTDNVVLCATFSEANTIIALGTLSSTIYVFSLKPTKLVQLKSASLLEKLDTGMAGIDKGMLDPLRKYTRRTLVGHQGPVYSCCFNPEDRYLLSSSEDHSVRLWCLLTWSCLVIYPGSLSPICHVIFAPRGYYFATASDDGMARIWAQDCRKPCRILEGHQAELTMCLFHPNRHYLATASADCTVRMWDVINGSQIRLFRGHKRRVSILTFSICGRYLVSGGDDNLIMIWDMPLGRLIRYLDYHTGHINTIEFCLDNNLLVVGGQDCRLSIWDFQRLLLDYEPAKVAKKESNNKDQLPFATQEELLINAYSTKNAPFYLIRFTRRNLLLAFCVTPEKSKMRNRHKIRPLDEDKRESRTWFDYLDTAKFEGICQSDFDLHFPGVDEKAQLKGKTKKNRSG
nr:transcription initiation factor TFIID subunit 5 [Drosophila bipectinata]